MFKTSEKQLKRELNRITNIMSKKFKEYAKEIKTKEWRDKYFNLLLLEESVDDEDDVENQVEVGSECIYDSLAEDFENFVVETYQNFI